MLESVDVGGHSVDPYEAIVGSELIARLRDLAEPLRGVRVLHLNATPYGGGVAEILRSQVPLLRDLGLAADWRRNAARWIWRCHIDTSEPHPGLWDFMRPFLDDYDAAVFTMQDFVPPDFPVARVEVIPPAIDPESPKNITAPRAASWDGSGWT